MENTASQEKDTKWLHKWGYADTEFVVHDDHSVVLSGNRYNLCGYRMCDFIPYLEDSVGVKFPKGDYMQEVADKTISPPKLNEDFYKAITTLFSESQHSIDDDHRLSHSHGQTSVDEVYRVLFAKLEKFVDLVVCPETEEQVIQLIDLAKQHNVCLIPYGGGSNVTNALKLPANETRMVVSVDMKAMNKVISVDKQNLRACVQAGITGSQLEEVLQEQGFVVGHEPDSVEISTLGGWIATNASGMKKNKYGNIEDIVENFTLITPTGVHEMASAFPRLSPGMNPMKLFVGNEGNLGIITKAIINIQPKPEERRYQAIIFPQFENGIHFLKELYFSGQLPASIRLMDNMQFKWGHALNPVPTKLQAMLSNIEKKALAFKKIDFDKLVVATILLEGSKTDNNQKEKSIVALAKKFGGIKAGAENGARGYKLTFAIAYIRELLNKLNMLGETFETTVPWENAQEVYDAVIAHANKKHKEYGLPGKPLICGRITQTYHSAVCMYFTYIIHIKGVEQPDVVFGEIEHSFRDIILQHGGSISHHHGIGKLRNSFMDKVLSQPNINMLREVKKSVDPQNIFGIRNNVMTDD